MSHTLLRNANVQVNQELDDKGRPLASILVDGQYKHTFPHTSRVSKHLDMMSPDDLATQMNGGQFFFVEDELVDFRYGSYNGFVHSDNNIQNFVDAIGYQRKDDMGILHLTKVKDEDHIQSPIVLRKIWDKNEISVPGYQQGGDFISMLSFTWNPFEKTINSAFDLVRFVCENGAVGVTSFLNTKIPLQNRWEEHLDIAARQIQNKVSSMVVGRVQSMTAERASLADCLLLEDHIMERLSGVEDGSEIRKLMNMMSAVSPRIQLENVYRSSVFEDRNVASQLPAHITNFDLYNLSTEVRTHTAATAKSSDRALDKLSNRLMFDTDGFATVAVRSNKPHLSAFSSAETAFFAEVA